MQQNNLITSNNYSGTDWLGRYYTTQPIGHLLVSLMRPEQPCTVLDLGSGAGTLAIAAARRWRETQLITVDIDRESTRLKIPNYENRDRHVHIKADALSIDLPKQIGVPLGSVDAAVCNPPYIRLPWRKGYAELLEEVGLSSAFPAIKDVSADVIFIAQNLRLLRNGGQMGLIVPDGLISGEKAAGVRKALIERHQIDCVIKLPRRVFVGTEAQAHILLLSKFGSNNEPIKLMEFGGAGGLSKPIFISPEDGLKRLDYSYFQFQRSQHVANKIKTITSLKQLGVSLVRGNLNSRQAKEADFPVFHTSSIPDNRDGYTLNVPKKLQLPKRIANSTSLIIADAGDILMARVGRGLENKVCMIGNGTVAITDCVYRLRVPIEWRTQVFTALISEPGKAFLRAVSHGVGAKHLSMQDLLDFSANGIG